MSFSLYDSMASCNFWVAGCLGLKTYPKDNDYVVRVDLPGVDPKYVHIQSGKNVLSISAERKTEEKGLALWANFLRQV